jgi:hypothetical protein
VQCADIHTPRQQTHAWQPDAWGLNHAKEQEFCNMSGYILTGAFCLGFEVQVLPCDLWLILTSSCASGEGGGLWVP